MKFGVFWFLNYENQVSGSKDKVETPKKLTIFREIQFFDKLSLTLSISVITYPNFLVIFLEVSSKLNREYEKFTSKTCDYYRRF